MDDKIGTETNSDWLVAYILYSWAMTFALGFLVGWYIV